MKAELIPEKISRTLDVDIEYVAYLSVLLPRYVGTEVEKVTEQCIGEKKQNYERDI